MKANELRIGNYVSELVLGIVPIFTIQRDTVWVAVKHNTLNILGDQHYHLDISSIEPIPLTEEWLLKFGFVRDSDSMDIRYKNSDDPGTIYEIRLIDQSLFRGQDSGWNLQLIEIFDEQDESDMRFVHIKRIDHVHQIQNLFYSLSGTELTINPK